jgi:hypothetical protein
MIITILAYILTLILGPMASGIGQLVFLPISIPLLKIGLHKFFIAFLGAVLAAFVATWVSTFIFGWLNREPGIWMLIVLGASFVINDLKRIKSGRDGVMESGYLIGDIAGIILGGYIFIYNS